MTATVETPAYIELLRTIGMPGLLAGNQGNRTMELMKLAELNKIALLYSNSLSDPDLHQDLLQRYQLLTDTVREVSALFNGNGITYSIFKTMKPFPTTPSDIDILLSREDFFNAEALLISTGYRKTANDGYTSTLTKEMNVDLQLQPSVSHLPYLSSKFLMRNTERKNLSGIDIRAPTPEAEIMVIASHCVYKEQMFTLNDYYTITILAEQVDSERLLALAREARVLEALRIVIGLCSRLTESVFNSKLKISEISSVLGSVNMLPIPNLPLKFPFSLVIRLLAARATKDGEMCRMVLPAIVRLASPGQLRRLFAHMKRETY